MEIIYDPSKRKFVLTCGYCYESQSLSLIELMKIVDGINKAFAKYKEEFLNTVNDGDYIVDTQHRSMYIIKEAVPNNFLKYHAKLLSDGTIYDNNREAVSKNTFFRVAEKEEIDYFNYILKRDGGVYFDEKEKKIKKI